MAELNVRVYVVEAQVPPNPTDPKAGLTGPAVPVQWVSVHTTESADEAVRVAKEEHNTRKTPTRVRQFWISRTIPQRDTLPKDVPATYDGGMEDMTCIEHPEVKLRWRMVLGGVTPTCSICHKPLVTQALVDSMSNPVDLSET